MNNQKIAAEDAVMDDNSILDGTVSTDFDPVPFVALYAQKYSQRGMRSHVNTSKVQLNSQVEPVNFSNLAV